MASDLEVLILILAVNQCRSRTGGANRSTSSAKSRDPILRSPNYTPSTPWLHLEILTLKVMKRIGDKGQPWQSPTLARNKSDLLPATQTRLWLRPYREQTTSILNIYTPREPPTGLSKGRSRMPQHMWTGWANSHHLPGPCWGCGAGPLFHV